MLNTKEKKVLIANLPTGWRKLIADEVGRSVSYVENIAYGKVENIVVFERLVALAEQHKLELETKAAELKERVLNLDKKITA